MESMNRWIKRLLVLLQIGGGYTGLCISLNSLFSLGCIDAEAISCIAFVLMYLFGIICGYLMIENEFVGIRYSMLYQLVQIASISTPLVTYVFSSGAMFNFVWENGNIGFHYEIGSMFKFCLYKDAPLAMSVNILPSLFFIFLLVTRNKGKC